MDESTTASSAYLMEIGIEELHKESRMWVSSINLWKRELEFFQKLLDTYSTKFETSDLKKQGDHFQNLIIYYNGELLESFKQTVRRQEKNLGILLAGTEYIDEVVFRNQHLEIKEKIDSFDTEFIKTKHDFFELIESVL